MFNDTHQATGTIAASAGLASFPALDQETRPTVTTEQAAYYLSRKPRTLRVWACYDNGPLQPRRVGGRLAWPMADIRRVLGVSA